MSGQAGEMANEASRFAERLRKELGLPTELLDERLTSWAAEHSQPEGAARRKGAPVDDLAAAILLREYLERSDERRPAAGEL